MCKIFILTQPLGHNYGGILQNYALQQVLLRMGVSPCTVITGNNFKGSFLDYAKPFLKKTIFRFKYGKQAEEQRKELIRYGNLLDFVEKHIVKTQCFRSRHAVQSFFGKKKENCMIAVGSDQVWRPMYSPCLPLFFCAFGTMRRIPHFAYAASFGVDTCEFTEKEKKMARKCLPAFKGISVREKSAVQLCKNHFLCDKAVAVPDPTLLLNADEYRKLFEKIDIPQSGLTCYFLDYTDQKKSAAKRFAEENGRMDINALLPWMSEKDAVKQEIVMRSVPDWISGIANAKYVMTDSFHGTVFSIIFHRQFAVTTTVERGNARVKDLLSDLGLSDRLVDINNYEAFRRILQTPVDYDAVEQHLGVLREKGISFLKEMLE